LIFEPETACEMGHCYGGKSNLWAIVQTFSMHRFM